VHSAGRGAERSGALRRKGTLRARLLHACPWTKESTIAVPRCARPLRPWSRSAHPEVYVRRVLSPGEARVTAVSSGTPLTSVACWVPQSRHTLQSLTHERLTRGTALWVGYARPGHTRSEPAGDRGAESCGADRSLQPQGRHCDAGPVDEHLFPQVVHTVQNSKKHPSIIPFRAAPSRCPHVVHRRAKSPHRGVRENGRSRHGRSRIPPQGDREQVRVWTEGDDQDAGGRRPPSTLNCVPGRPVERPPDGSPLRRGAPSTAVTRTVRAPRELDQ